MAQRFKVTKTTSPAKIPLSSLEEADPLNASKTSIDGLEKDVSSNHILSDKEKENKSHGAENLLLYEDDMQSMPPISLFLRRFIFPGQKEREEFNKSESAHLGILLGVYLPTIQHIFGVLMFLRLFWIVGNAGILESFFLVFICCLTTFLTSISMCALATNGVVESGGSYFILSRNLGPEFGGSVGILFYLGNTFATSMYIIGAVEILLTYIAPQISIYGDHQGEEDPAHMFNNFRVYGTVLLLVLFVIVAVGVKFVQMFAPFSLACVIVSILAIFAGSFVANPGNSPKICLLGERLLSSHAIELDGQAWCTKEATVGPQNATGPIYAAYCPIFNASSGSRKCDEYFLAHETSYVAGIPGYASGIFSENVKSQYRKVSEVTPGVVGERERGEVLADITTTFFILMAIYFPSVTGIMTGSNMSGDLNEPQQSIPVGTLAATLTTSLVYLSFIFVFGGTIHGALLRDKYGESLSGQMVVAALSWPSQWVLLVGSFTSTFGAALQCLCSAPRLLQAIAKDSVMPFLATFSDVSKKGEPLKALVLTTFIAELGILIGALDHVAPVVDMFFLMCYFFVNFVCVLQTLMKTPNWRPRFKFYHWILSLLGALLCVFIMFTSHWYYALAALAFALIIYKYIEYKGAKKEWGDGIRGLALSTARYSLLKVEDEDQHAKNWRPQILMLSNLDNSLQPKHRKIFNLVGNLKAGRGLVVVASVLQGEYSQLKEDAKRAKQNLKLILDEEKVKGFVTILVTSNITEGLGNLIQTVGIGGMRPNTVVIGWPCETLTEDFQEFKNFVDTVRNISAAELALLVPKGMDHFPDSKQRLSGSIDVWWILHDGGLLVLLSFLLKRHRVWKKCKIRIFSVAQMQDNSVKMKKDLTTFFYHLRIEVEVHIIEMYDNAISAYTYECTLQMEERSNILKQIHLSKNKIQSEAQFLVDDSHRQSSSKDSLPVPSEKMLTVKYSVEKETATADVESGRFGTDSDVTDEAVITLKVPGKEEDSDSLSEEEKNSYTFSSGLSIESRDNARKMHTAVKLNSEIKKRSNDAELIVMNLPGPPKDTTNDANYIQYLEVLTEGLSKILLVRGSGKEVITIYS